MNNNQYLIYQATRPKSSYEQRQIDQNMGELAATFGRRRHRTWLRSRRGQSVVITGRGACPDTA
jgi:hypothetical protein